MIITTTTTTTATTIIIINTTTTIIIGIIIIFIIIWFSREAQSKAQCEALLKELAEVTDADTHTHPLTLRLQMLTPTHTHSLFRPARHTQWIHSSDLTKIRATQKIYIDIDR